MDWYKRYLGDYARDTGRLSVMEHGAYNLMLDQFYSTEEALPVEHDEIYRLVRAIRPEEQAAVDKILVRYWRLTDDGYVNNKAIEIIRQRHALSKKNQQTAIEREAARRAEREHEQSTKRAESVAENSTNTRVQSPESKTERSISDPESINKGKIVKPALPRNLTERVFEYWQKRLFHPQSKLSDKRRRRIVQAYKAGFTEDDMRQAIDGCVKTPHNMGQNETGQVYDDLELILRDVEHIERFMGNAVPPGEKKNPEAEARFEQIRQRSIARGEADMRELNQGRK